jgi:hypothetical protein
MTKAPRITPQMLHTYVRQLSDGDPVRYKQELEKIEREMERIHASMIVARPANWRGVSFMFARH